MTRLQHFEIITENMKDLFKAKDSAYGQSYTKNFERLGLAYPISRLYEKVDRLMTLKDGDVADNGESITDNLLDIANIAVLALIELQTPTREEPVIPKKEEKATFDKYALLENIKAYEIENLSPRELISLDESARDIWIAYMHTTSTKKEHQTEKDIKLLRLQKEVAQIVMHLELKRDTLTDDEEMFLLVHLQKLNDELGKTLFGF